VEAAGELESAKAMAQEADCKAKARAQAEKAQDAAPIRMRAAASLHIRERVVPEAEQPARLPFQAFLSKAAQRP
jgi:hypothetical protein